MLPNALRRWFAAPTTPPLREGGRYRLRSWPENMTAYTLVGDRLVPDDDHLPPLLVRGGIVWDERTPISQTDDIRAV